MPQNRLIDGFGREIDYIRISLTERCNFTCLYCRAQGVESPILADEVPLNDLFSLVKVAIENGVKKVRISGGEPLLRHDLPEFISKISAFAPSVDIALTTNAYFLAQNAQKLRAAGLNRLNISLDTLQKDRLKKISGNANLERILDGIMLCKKLGFKLKINMVPLRGINDDEILDLLDFGLENKILVRFIEFMENSHASSEISGLRDFEILEKIAAKYTFKEIKKDFFGPAKLYEIDFTKSSVSDLLKNSYADKFYSFGIIAPHNDDFCKTCNRIRLDSQGRLIPCLYHENAINIKEELKKHDEIGLLAALKKCIEKKPEKNDWNSEQSERAFYQTGG